MVLHYFRNASLPISIFLIAICGAIPGFSQAPVTRADTLRGMLTAPRTCYDVTYYALDLKVDPTAKWINGSSRIEFNVLEKTKSLQIDLYSNLIIRSIKDGRGKNLSYTREANAVFVHLKQKLKPGKQGVIFIEYEGSPVVAQNPPWEGGFSWEKDKSGQPWVVVTCQGDGASLWWPNKDHQSDEPDSMSIRITVPTGLQAISNGRLRETQVLTEGWTRYSWFVQNPINNYNVTLNIGNYQHIKDWYVNEHRDSLSLDYYIMPDNLSRARAQFKQVQPMLSCFEDHFGPYPFPEDGYKLIEAPHPGMEHQSAIAYGNHYENGYLGRASSQEGLWFDFILIHETAHEWFGNSLTSRDIADMWIHESFGTYLEAVYVECLYGYEAACRYMEGKRNDVLLDRPIIGTYEVNRPGSVDMYAKGALMLHTLRQIVHDDEKWWAALKKLSLSYRHQNISYEEVTSFLSQELDRNLASFFEQYIKRTVLPKLQIKWKREGEGSKIQYRWVTDVRHFEMPVRVIIGGEEHTLDGTNSWKTIPLKQSKQPVIQLDSNTFVTMEYTPTME